MLAGGSWGLAVPFPELALEVVHVGFVGGLVHWCSCLRRKRAAGTRDDFIPGHQGALWMTSSMDATEGGRTRSKK